MKAACAKSNSVRSTQPQTEDEITMLTPAADALFTEFLEKKMSQLHEDGMAEALRPLLREVWMHPFKTRSNSAREFASDIAVAASMGWITTRVHGQGWGDWWRITGRGLAILEEGE